MAMTSSFSRRPAGHACDKTLRQSNSWWIEAMVASVMSQVNASSSATSQENDSLSREDYYHDLNGFLQETRRSDVRLAAVSVVLELLHSHDAQSYLAHLVQHGVLITLIPSISYSSHDDEDDDKSSSATDSMISWQALQSLLFVSSVDHGGPFTNQCIHDLVTHQAIPRLVEMILSTSFSEAAILSDSAPALPPSLSKRRINCALGILANLTRLEAGAVEFVGKAFPPEAVYESVAVNDTKPTVEILLARFLNPAYGQGAVKSFAPCKKQNDDEDAIFGSEIRREEANDGSESNPSRELEAAMLDTSAHDPYQHFAAILLNMTQTQAGRQFVLRIHDSEGSNGSNSVLQQILPQLRSPNVLRRRGVAGAIRNCCLERESTWWMLHVLNITHHVLFPLAGPEELDLDEKQGLHPDLWLLHGGPDKVREPDYHTRLFLVETILLLCMAGRQNREKLRLDRAYVILKYADMVEEQEEVSSRIDDCVQYLRRDEAGTAEGSSDQLVGNAYKPIAAPQSSATRTTSTTAAFPIVGRDDDDFDAVD
jgi:Domain of unknown function (DUF383)/Domain of unknown function (DUF384)